MDIKELLNEIKNDKKKLVGSCCLLIVILAMIAGFTSPDGGTSKQYETQTTTENLFNQSTVISTSQWDYTPDGFSLIDKEAYGSCEGVDSNGVSHTYFFTDPQMAALGNISDYSFGFDNLHVIAENRSGHLIVTHIFYQNGSEVSCDWNVYDFKAYAKVAGANNPNCVSGFGYSASELNVE